ncbi:ABC transporter permease [Phytoactinopolyspora alkaliphila]|uniref:ABC transporter permease n=2 Tax=Phytoactinopolyspora alkaliphila TaxID=1783498 RepID=A0A6N9YMG8_9ACTN|nr:ABC transporter permease [Phytoactinopolyspora alkaliphila]
MTDTSQSGLSPLTGSARAELLRLRKWPAVWIMVAVWLLLDLLFAYVFNYVAYRTGSGPFGGDGVPPDALLADMAADAVPRIFTAGMPMFGGAIMLILGALATGSGYGWGTWKTTALQGPGRISTFGGTLGALAAVVASVVVATFVLNLAAAMVIAGVEGQPITWPNAGEAAQALGAGALIFGMWTAAGAFVGVLTRSPALAVGLGLVWSMAVENLLRGVSGILPGLEYVTDVLPGTAAGSLAGALGAGDQADGDGAPGVLTILDAGPAAVLLAGYLVVFVLVATTVSARRDLT